MWCHGNFKCQPIHSHEFFVLRLVRQNKCVIYSSAIIDICIHCAHIEWTQREHVVIAVYAEYLYSLLVWHSIRYVLEWTEWLYGIKRGIINQLSCVHNLWRKYRSNTMIKYSNTFKLENNTLILTCRMTIKLSHTCVIHTSNEQWQQTTLLILKEEHFVDIRELLVNSNWIQWKVSDYFLCFIYCIVYLSFHWKLIWLNWIFKKFALYLKLSIFLQIGKK